MRLEQLSYIIEVAKEHNITKAAKNLYISQPTLSNAITAFEEELAIEVFHRSRNGTSLTPIGRVIVSKAQNIINEINDIQRLSLKNKDVDKLKIQLLAIPLFCHSLVLDVMMSFKKDYANVDILINETTIENIINQVYKGTADIGLVAYTSLVKSALAEEIATKNLHLHTLFKDYFYVYVRSDHPLAKYKSITVDELINHEIVLFSSQGYKGIRNDLALPKTKDTAFCVLHDKESIKRLVADYQYATMMPSFIYKGDPDILSGSVIPIPLNDFDTYFEISTLTNCSITLSNIETHFLEMIVAKGRVLSGN